MRGFTTTVATTWPFTRRTEALAVGGAGFGCGAATGGAGVGVGGVGDEEGGGGGGADGGVVTVSTWLAGAKPAIAADTVGVPGCVSV